MRTITVNVRELIDTLAENAEGHKATFDAAMEVFEVQAIKVLQEQIETIREGGLPDRYLRLPVPEEHTKDYERALQMLEWHQEQTIELTEAEFAQYVQDDWGWRQSFLSNTASYTQPA